MLKFYSVKKLDHQPTSKPDFPVLYRHTQQPGVWSIPLWRAINDQFHTTYVEIDSYEARNNSKMGNEIGRRLGLDQWSAPELRNMITNLDCRALRMEKRNVIC